MSCVSFTSLVSTVFTTVHLLIVWLAILSGTDCIIYFKKPTIHPSFGVRVDPSKEICEGHHPPGYNTSQLGKGPYNVSTEWLSDRYMWIRVRRTELKMFIRSVLVQVSYNGVPIGTVKSYNDEDTYINCPPGVQNTAYAYYKLKKKRAWYKWYPPTNFNFKTNYVVVHCTPMKQPGLYWRLNTTSSSYSEDKVTSTTVNYGSNVYDVPWSKFEKYHSSEMDNFTNMKNYTKELLPLLLRLKFATTWNVDRRPKDYQGECKSSLKKILSPKGQPYWNRYKKHKEQFYYDGPSVSHQCP